MPPSSPISQDEINSILWKACDILRGEIEPSEYKNIILTILFLKYISDSKKDIDEKNERRKQSDRVFNIPQGCSFDELSEKVGQPNFGDVVNRALAEIENANRDKLDGVLSVTDFNNRRVNPRELASRLGHIFSLFTGSNFDFRPSVFGGQIAGDTCSFLIDKLAQQEGYRGGEGYTPQNLLPLLVNLLQPTDGKSLYDPAVGTGGMLIAANKFVKEQSPNSRGLSLFGQDVSANSVSISKIHLLMHQIFDAKIYLGDTIRDPKNIQGGRIQKFDYVLSSPPFSLQIHGADIHELEWRASHRFPFGFPGRIADYLFLQHIYSSLNENGKAVVVVSGRALFVSGAESEIRKRFIESDSIEAVISLGPGLLTNTAIPIHLLIINKLKPAERKGKILLINASEEYERIGRRGSILTQENQNKIVEAYKNFRPIKSLANLADLSAIQENEYNLMPARYLDLFSMDDFLGGEVTWESFENIADIHRSVASTNQSGGSENTPIIKASNISNRQINIEDLDKVQLPADNTRVIYTQTGDVLFSHVGGNKAVLIDENLNGVLVSNNISVIRLKPDYVHLKRYIVEFLRSDKGYNLLSKYFVGAAAAPVLRLSDLRSVKIPIPEVSVTQLISNIHQVEMDLFQRIEKAQELRTKLFNITDSVIVQKQLDELGTETKILSSSLVQADSLDYQVRNFYPYPLAFAYRTLSAIHDPIQKYPEQLRVAENLLVFLATVGLTIAQLDGELKNQSDITNAIIRNSFGGGISPGDWRSLAQFSGKSIRGQRRYAIGNSFAALWFKGSGSRETEFASNTQKLVELKNDYKHDRGPKTPHDFTLKSDEIQSMLDFCYTQLAFLIKYPIRLVQSLDVEYLTNMAILETLVYEGDHPGLRREQVHHPKPLPKDMLYLEVDKDLWAPLYPHLRVCSKIT
jgi:type I restriction enzyme M protein